ncbi:MAG: AMP-binding protein [Alteromonadaceae bacterium]|nr:AMP-binding protein [Alteromonadaceae bacterium]
MTLPAYVARNARKYPEHEAVVSQDSRNTWAQLNSHVNKLAHLLKNQHDIGSGDRVALVLPNIYAFVVSYFAIQRIGAIVVPVNVRLATPELDYILKDSEAALVLTCKLTDEALQPLAGDEVTALWLDDLDGTLAGQPDTAATCNNGDEAPCALLYTSGTTGHPKGVLFNHKALIAVATMFAVEMQYQPESRLLSLMPFTHSAPLNLTLVAGTMVGCTHVIAPTFSPELLLKLVEEERTTHFFGAPVAYLLTAQHQDIANTDLSSMTHWIYGGGPLAADHAAMVQKAFNSTQFYCVYGLTEAGPTGTLLLPQDDASKAGSIGKRAALNTEIRLAGENNEPVGVNQPGEIQLAGDGLMLEYWRNPEAAQASITADGWLKTGDIAVRDDDGFYWIKDRKKDLIISGGVNVYPREIEDALATHPAIAESAVIGVPHPQWGESVKAHVVLKEKLDDTEAELKAFLKPLLADYKIPRYVSVMDELPHNANGKVLKHELRKGNKT